MHKEALTNTGKQIFVYFKRFNSYYLAGGTAIAIQIGHRVSVDFDFFSDEKIPKTLLPELKKLFPRTMSIRASVNNSDELTIFANDTKITFLYYPFTLIKPKIDIEGLQVANLKELAAMKAYTIGRRADYKDYIDIYYLLAGKYTLLQEIIEIAKKKYRDDFNDRLFLEQLIYLDDINTTKIELLKKEQLTKESMKAFFIDEVKNIVL